MLQFVKSEQVGVSSKNIMRYLHALEQAGLSGHAVIMMRHGKVFFEKYWAPFHKYFGRVFMEVSFVDENIMCVWMRSFGGIFPG